MGRNRKKWMALLAAVALCAGTAGMAAPMQVSAAEDVNDNAAEGEVVVVRTTQRCSIWSAPATTEENRTKYVDEGYQIQVYPQPIESELPDGKTFYRTIKGAYVLCRCVEGTEAGTETETGTESGIETGTEGGNAPAPEDNGILVPVGDVPSKAFINAVEVELWYNKKDDNGVRHSWGISVWGEQDTPVTDSFGITYRGYMINDTMEIVAQAAAGDAEIAQFLTEHGNRILICNGYSIYNSEWLGQKNQGFDSYTWGYTSVECQRGDCIAIVTSVYSEDVESSVSVVTECLHSILKNNWQSVLLQ